MATDLHHAANFLGWHLGFRRNLLASWFTTKLLQQMLLNVAQLAHGFNHVHRHANGSRMIGDGSRDRLANPPCRIRAELVATLILVLVHGAHQTGVAFLNNVKERQATVAILLGNADHQA